jgi:hypothetical protein
MPACTEHSKLFRGHYWTTSQICEVLDSYPDIICTGPAIVRSHLELQLWKKDSVVPADFLCWEERERTIISEQQTKFQPQKAQACTNITDIFQRVDSY